MVRQTPASSLSVNSPAIRRISWACPLSARRGNYWMRRCSCAGIERRDVYVTNVVKHFKFTEAPSPRGKQRLHKKPNWREVSACRPWLEAELETIQPKVVVCLGATAAQALIGRDFRITQDRGKIVATDWCQQTLATWHPAAVLRQPDVGRQDQMKQQLIEDLKAALDCQT